MMLLNFLQNYPVMQWAILLLSASIAFRTLMSLVYQLISLKSSTLSKSQKESLTNFLQILSNCSTEIIPNLSQALKTVLLNKGLLSLQNQNQQISQEQTSQEQTSQEQMEQPVPNDEATALDAFIDFVKAFKETTK